MSDTMQEVYDHWEDKSHNMLIIEEERENTITEDMQEVYDHWHFTSFIQMWYMMFLEWCDENKPEDMHAADHLDDAVEGDYLPA